MGVASFQLPLYERAHRMKEELNDTRHRELAEKWLNGTITPDEEQEYARWYNQIDPEEALDIPVQFAAGREDHRKKILKNIDDKITVQSAAVAKVSFIRRYWMAAAIILILITVAALSGIFREPAEQVQIAVAPSSLNDILAGRDGAVLTLADGSTVVLDTLGNGIIATQSGTQVMLTDGLLAYEAPGQRPLSSSPVTYNSLITPKGRQFQIVLPDGTRVWLNAASSLSYPTVFSGSERKVEITGEAYFEVAKNEQAPFRVKVNGETDIEVLGTHFNINSYPDEGNIRTTLLEGSVMIRLGSARTMLSPGQQAMIAFPDSHSSARPVSDPIKLIKRVDTERIIAWKSGAFNFQDASIEEVMRQFARWYDIEVVYEKGVPDIEFGGKMGRDLSLSDALRMLAKAKVNFRLEEGRKLVISP